MSGTGTNLLDKNRSPLPLCNVETDGVQYFIADNQVYMKAKEKVSKTESMLTIAVIVFLVLCTIFTMNLQSAGWTAGNVITAGVAVFLANYIYTASKTWASNYNTLQSIYGKGNPCLKDENGSKIVHCGANTNSDSILNVPALIQKIEKIGG